MAYNKSCFSSYSANSSVITATDWKYQLVWMDGEFLLKYRFLVTKCICEIGGNPKRFVRIFFWKKKIHLYRMDSGRGFWIIKSNFLASRQFVSFWHFQKVLFSMMLSKWGSVTSGKLEFSLNTVPLPLPFSPQQRKHILPSVWEDHGTLCPWGNQASFGLLEFCSRTKKI